MGGDANDHGGKGASGGRAIVRAPSTVTGDPTQRIRYGFRLLTARQPLREELLPLVGLFQRQHARFADTPELSDQLIAVGASQANPSLPRNALAAYTIVCNVMLNLDECITKQ
ncbi:MAG: hypothetical protein ABGZ17_22895 [Planctomycetaceae bacterium]